MLITLPGPPPNAPAGCAFCGKPFRKVGAGVQIWRSTSGHCFCSEFCADDAEEASFQKSRTRASLPEPLRPVNR